jgi:hypothetical protein
MIFANCQACAQNVGAPARNKKEHNMRRMIVIQRVLLRTKKNSSLVRKTKKVIWDYACFLVAGG